MGTGFPTSGKDAILIINGVQSTSAVINDATSVTATFASGIPAFGGSVTPSLRFAPVSGGRRMLLDVSYDDQEIAFSSGITFTNALSVTASSSGVTCSF